MTIKELADVAGVSKDTIRRKINVLFPGVIQKGVKTELSEDQSKIVMSHVRKKNMVNMQDKQTAQVDKQTATVGTPIEMAIIKLIDQNTKMMAMMMQRMDSIESKIPSKTKPLSLPAPSKSDRARFNQIIKGHARLTRQPTGSVYGKVYAEVYYRLRIDLQKRSSNKKCTKVDILEQEGLLPQAIAIAQEVLI